ncbi:hypothetical protein ANOM_000253 [Aspergillus nomiae NRRL 13137]|uniref:non-specific serine/threonine protein kinase n=1 Tax=Aspergillus nomiae NRRL (strain ATCC 15546 / NRRL 13137 / CBS 260.88 / M93) TaxID=1509407 RepID=A0A0L1JIW2_ASPN3|nr:uncharacterized protein ANOM_000253 [Aspergillus nomiae NRRL 13137]KNG91705.1 hypothetical protein ANOM_000253 [Aspergillus nomiae NRRL 13137]
MVFVAPLTIKVDLVQPRYPGRSLHSALKSPRQVLLRGTNVPRPRENPLTEAHCNVWDWDRLRKVKVKGSAKLFPPDEDIEILILAQFADYLSPEVRTVTVDDDGLLAGVSTDPEEDDTPFEYIAGGTLDNTNVPFRFEWLQQLIRLVDFLNRELGIMHQDIAPRNLLIDPGTNNILLFDFDWAACGKKRLPGGRDDVTGVVFTLYELITNDTQFTSIPHWTRTMDMVQGIQNGLVLGSWTLTYQNSANI